MTVEQTVVFAILLATLVFFVWGRWRYDIVALGALFLVFIAGLIPPAEVFVGFGHPAVITVAAVLVISRGLLNAGVVDGMSRLLARVGTRPMVQVATLTGIVVLCSGFMNNVGALALLMPVAIWMSRQSGRSPSLLLMPLAFGSLIGGLLTLIGTPPNIIIATYRTQTGAPPFGMFDFAPVGVGVAVVGLIFIALVGWRLTPRRDSGDASEELFEIDDYITEVVVPESSKMVNQTVYHMNAAMEEGKQITVAGLIRGDRHIPAPSWYEVLQAGDLLIVEADSDELQFLIEELGFELAENKVHSKESMESDDIRIIEAIVTPGSPMAGKTAVGMRLRRTHFVNLLAVARQGQRLKSRLGQIRIAIGDILLLQGSQDALQAALTNLGCLPLAERGFRLPKPRKVLMAVAIFGAAMAAAAFNLLPVQIAFLAAALIMVVTGLIKIDEIYDSIDWPIIILLGAMFPLGHALETTGGAQLIAGKMLLLSDHFPPVVTLAVLMVGTMLLSNVVNNAAAAVLMAPIAISLSVGMGVSVDPLLMGVAVGASCAFLTPVGHQSNALVMAPGGYRFGDYWRLGLPMSILVVAVGVPLIAVFWAF
ncbi:MAG: SLC13 family permease [Desulfatitalea sp.]|nr:SLC13 family permease [Desulfatitalea sp.]